MSQILEALNWRYATKMFDANKKVSEAHWKVLRESLRLDPSSYGLQPWEFIVVQTSETRKNCVKCRGNAGVKKVRFDSTDVIKYV
jgi:nitroreductase